MITGELKHKIDSLWEMFWTGGLTNPLDVVEQMTYLMFIRDLDDTDRLRAREAAMLGLPHESIFAGTVKIGEREVEGDLLRWSKFQDIGAEQMYETVQTLVFPFIKGLHGNKESAYSKYMDDAIFKLPTPLLLSKVVDGLNEIYRLMAQNPGSDMRGDTYEYLLSKIAQSGVNGQFRTPRHIIRMMVELMAPQPTDTICDPACGTSGFLVAAGEYLKTNCREAIFFDQQAKEHYMTKMFTGYDMDRTMLRIGAMNMMTHGVENPVIAYRDSLSDQNPDRDAYSLILANPPFKGSLDADIVSADLLKVCKTKKTELLFLALFLRMLRNRRALRLHRAGRRALWVLQGPQSHPPGAGGREPPGSRYLHALRRLQALCRGVHRHPHLHKDRARRHRPSLVLRHEGRRLLPGRQTNPRLGKRYPGHHRPLPKPSRRTDPPAHGTLVLRAQGGDRGKWL